MSSPVVELTVNPILAGEVSVLGSSNNATDLESQDERHPQLQLGPASSLRSRLYHIIHSLAVQFIILFLVILDVAVVAVEELTIDQNTVNGEQRHWMNVLVWSILLVFAFEIVLKFVILRPYLFVKG